MATKVILKEEVIDFFLNNSVSISVVINGKTYHFLHFSPWIKLSDTTRGGEKTVEMIPLGQLPEEVQSAIKGMREAKFNMPNAAYPLTEKDAFKKD